MKRRLFVMLSIAAVTLNGEVAPAPSRAADAPRLDAPGARDRRLREAELRRRLERASAAKIHEAMVEILSRPRTAATAGDYLVSLEVLAQKTGEAALTFAREHPFVPMEVSAMRASFIRGWTQTEPDAAEAWLAADKSGLNSEEKVELTHVVLRVDAQTDAQRALQRAARMAETTADPRSQRQNYAMTVMESLVYFGEFQKAWETSASLEPIEIRDAVRANLVGLTADHQPEKAIVWFRALPVNEERSGALFRLLEALSGRNFIKAVDFYRSLDAKDRSSDLLGTLIAHGNDPAPMEIDALLKDRPAGTETDQLITVAVAKIEALRPTDTPWEWLGRISDRRMRDRFLRELLLPRFRKDPEAARRTVEAMKFLAEDERTAFLPNLELKNAK
jgi:hypothetical protein